MEHAAAGSAPVSQVHKGAGENDHGEETEGVGTATAAANKEVTSEQDWLVEASSFLAVQRTDASYCWHLMWMC